MGVSVVILGQANTDWSFMALMALIMLSVCGIIALVAILAYLEKRNRNPHNTGPDSVCGRCGYSVRDLTTMTCPECGADLREVGIIPPDKPGRSKVEKPIKSEPATRAVTVLLTDMRDYTARFAQSSRDDAMALLRRHRDVVQPIVLRHGGQIVKSTGDGLIAVLDSPTEALLAALEIQKSIALLNEQAFSDKDKFQLRIGVATGEVAFVDGDVYGHPVNLASRLQSLGAPGDVYFSESTFHLINRSEIQFEPLGPTEIKGLAEHVNVYRCRPSLAGQS